MNWQKQGGEDRGLNTPGREGKWGPGATHWARQTKEELWQDV